MTQDRPGCSLTRRELLRRSGMGFAMLGLTGVLSDNGRLLAAPVPSNPSEPDGGYKNPLAERPPHFAAKAKRVIFLFMNGGPSHVDTFDPKPALEKYAGQQPTGELFKKSRGTGFMPSPLKFSKRGKAGIDVSESLPYMGGVIDDCCVIRSMRTDVPN